MAVLSYQTGIFSCRFGVFTTSLFLLIPVAIIMRIHKPDKRKYAALLKMMKPWDSYCWSICRQNSKSWKWSISVFSGSSFISYGYILMQILFSRDMVIWIISTWSPTRLVDVFSSAALKTILRALTVSFVDQPSRCGDYLLFTTPQTLRLYNYCLIGYWEPSFVVEWLQH